MAYSENSIALLQKGGVGVLPTDTLYGLVASAFQDDAVERIYHVKHRNPKKPLIILLSSKDELHKFGIIPTLKEEALLHRVWPGKVSVVLRCANTEFSYLSRGTGTLSFRIPERKDLRKYLKKTGPLVAPSANPEGDLPAETITEARKYFGDSVDFYEDDGALRSEPSTLIQIQNGTLTVLRQGAVTIDI